MEKEYNPLYQKEQNKDHLVLNDDQKERVRQITLGIEEVDENILNLALEDVINTLENGHLLNRLIEQNGNVEGYIACEDFIPQEAYIKYFGTTKQTGRNLLIEIPAFLEYAKSKGYTKLNFHGWNDRLNNILTRFGFERIRTDKMMEQRIDFYEKTLVESKPKEEIEQDRIQAFEQKYINKLNKDYEQILNTFKEDNLEDKKSIITETYKNIEQRFNDQNEELSDRQKSILKLKLARHFQNNKSIDTNVMYDVLIESPKFILNDKGSLNRLLDVHQEKTLQKIAEMRKNRAEQTGTGFNPYEALYTTQSGNYYMAKLLNMPHLEQESEYMNHCVGTSDSYINKIKKGDVEILSFRNVPKINPKTNKLFGDTPIITIEYNLRTKTIQQMKKNSDEYLSQDDPYFNDAIDALKQLRKTQTDSGELRDFKSISTSELGNINVKPNHIFTENGEMSLSDYSIDSNVFVLKLGNFEISKDIPKEDIQKVLFLTENIKINPNQIATNSSEVNENTKVYIGDWSVDMHNQLPYTIEHIYNQNIENKVFRRTIELSTKTSQEYTQAIINRDYQISSYATDILNKLESLKNNQEVNLVSFKVQDLGFPNGATISEIYTKAIELGLDICDPHVGPEMRLALIDQKNNTYYRIAMDGISDRFGCSVLFSVNRSSDEDWLNLGDANPSNKYSADNTFVFSSRKRT